MSNSVTCRSLHGVIVCLAVWIAVPSAVRAQSAENVAVVVNENSADSRRIAEHYARARSLPPDNVLRIRTSTGETVGRDEYLRTIERPLARAIQKAGLQDRLLYVVLTKGVPLRVEGTAGVNGSAGSVDSELTLLYRRLVGQLSPPDGKVDNPYYLGVRDIGAARPFSHRDHDIYLVTRIDAFTVEEALALIDRAQTPTREGRIVLDQRGEGTGDQWMQTAASRLAEQGHGARVLLQATPDTGGENAVLGYYSWGAADPDNRVRSRGLPFAPGSIAAALASFDARTFQQPPTDWRPTSSSAKAAWFAGTADALIADLIRDGITGVSGQVNEAYVLGAVRPEILFPAYMAGFNLVEAFYLATPTLSWQTVIVGDPLCAPFGRQPLTREQLEEPVDTSTGYPGLYSKRREAVILAANRDVPATAAAPLMRAQALLDREDRAGARRALEEVVALVPRAVGPLVGLAELEEQMGEYDAAIARYRHVLEVQPDHMFALNNLAYALAVRRNAPKEALPFAQKAAAAAPGNASIVDTFAWIQHLLGNNELAAKLYDQVVKLAPAQAEIRLHAAVTYAAVGNRGRAETELREALRLDPLLEQRTETQQLRRQIAGGAGARP